MLHPRVKYRISTKVGSTEVATIDDLDWLLECGQVQWIGKEPIVAHSSCQPRLYILLLWKSEQQNVVFVSSKRWVCCQEITDNQWWRYNHHFRLPSPHMSRCGDLMGRSSKWRRLCHMNPPSIWALLWVQSNAPFWDFAWIGRVFFVLKAMSGRVRLKYWRLPMSVWYLVGDGRRSLKSLSNLSVADNEVDVSFVSAIPDLCSISVIYFLWERNMPAVEGITSTPKK